MCLIVMSNGLLLKMAKIWKVMRLIKTLLLSCSCKTIFNKNKKTELLNVFNKIIPLTLP